MLDQLMVHFSVSGVKTLVFLPPLVAFVVSFFTSMGGVSGAFLLLPFQVSFLNFTTPAVSSTNLLFNIVAIPSGVYRYIKEGRMAWPLTWIVILGTLPGVFIGYYLRVLYFPDPGRFKVFVGGVLLYIGLRLLRDFIPRSPKKNEKEKALDKKFNHHIKAMRNEGNKRTTSGLPTDAVVNTLVFSWASVEYEFWGQKFSFSTMGMCTLAFFVGIIGGTYGIGGGAIIAPFCVAIFRLPVYTVAGAALMGTLITSFVGVIFYTFIPAAGGLPTAPDWPLGLLFGAGGLLGMYCGARLQKYVPQILIKLFLGFVITFVAGRYILQYFIK